MREILLYLPCRVARSLRGGDSIHSSRNRMLYLDNLGKALNCKLKHEPKGSMKGTLNQTRHHSGLRETVQLVSCNRDSRIMTWHSQSYQRLPYMMDSTAAFNDNFRFSKG